MLTINLIKLNNYYRPKIVIGLNAAVSSFLFILKLPCLASDIADNKKKYAKWIKMNKLHYIICYWIFENYNSSDEFKCVRN